MKKRKRSSVAPTTTATPKTPFCAPPHWDPFNFGVLDQDTVQVLLSFLDIPSRVLCSSVSSAWWACVRDPVFWLTLGVEKFAELPSRLNLLKSIYRKDFLAGRGRLDCFEDLQKTMLRGNWRRWVRNLGLAEEKFSALRGSEDRMAQNVLYLVKLGYVELHDVEWMLQKGCFGTAGFQIMRNRLLSKNFLSMLTKNAFDLIAENMTLFRCLDLKYFTEEDMIPVPEKYLLEFIKGDVVYALLKTKLVTLADISTLPRQSYVRRVRETSRIVKRGISEKIITFSEIARMPSTAHLQYFLQHPTLSLIQSRKLTAEEFCHFPQTHLRRLFEDTSTLSVYHDAGVTAFDFMQMSIKQIRALSRVTDRGLFKSSWIITCLTEKLFTLEDLMTVPTKILLAMAELGDDEIEEASEDFGEKATGTLGIAPVEVNAKFVSLIRDGIFRIPEDLSCLRKQTFAEVIRENFHMFYTCIKEKLISPAQFSRMPTSSHVSAVLVGEWSIKCLKEKLIDPELIILLPHSNYIGELLRFENGYYCLKEGLILLEDLAAMPSSLYIRHMLASHWSTLCLQEGLITVSQIASLPTDNYVKELFSTENGMHLLQNKIITPELYGTFTPTATALLANEWAVSCLLKRLVTVQELLELKDVELWALFGNANIVSCLEENLVKFSELASMAFGYHQALLTDWAFTRLRSGELSPQLFLSKLPNPNSLSTRIRNDKWAILSLYNDLFTLESLSSLDKQEKLAKRWEVIFSEGGFTALLEKLLSDLELSTIDADVLYQLVTPGGLTCLREKLITTSSLKKVLSRYLSVVFSEDGINFLRGGYMPFSEILILGTDLLSTLITPTISHYFKEKLFTPEELINIRDLERIKLFALPEAKTLITEGLVTLAMFKQMLPRKLVLLISNLGIQCLRERLFTPSDFARYHELNYLVIFGDITRACLETRPKSIKALKEVPEFIYYYERFPLLSKCSKLQGLMPARCKWNSSSTESETDDSDMSDESSY